MVETPESETQSETKPETQLETKPETQLETTPETGRRSWLSDAVDAAKKGDLSPLESMIPGPPLFVLIEMMQFAKKYVELKIQTAQLDYDTAKLDYDNKKFIFEQSKS